MDGVVNALDPAAEWERWERRTVARFPICWSPSVVSFLADLSRRVEVLWLTTWEESAQTQLAPALGLPHFGLAGTRPDYVPDGWWKLDVVQGRWHDDPVPFVWVDDDLKIEAAAREWLGQLPENQALGLSPPSATGLTAEHLAQTWDFVHRHLDGLPQNPTGGLP